MHSMFANALDYDGTNVSADDRALLGTRQAVGAAVEIASISEGFGQGDYEYLDGTLSVRPILSEFTGSLYYVPPWSHGIYVFMALKTLDDCGLMRLLIDRKNKNSSCGTSSSRSSNRNESACQSSPLTTTVATKTHPHYRTHGCLLVIFHRTHLRSDKSDWESTRRT